MRDSSRLNRVCGELSSVRVVVLGLLLALAIELLTAWLRFGWGLISAQHGGILGRWVGIRIHHGYVGVLLAVLAAGPLRHRHGLRKALLIVSWGLVVSDLVHHFLVLWPITGSPQFDFVYPPAGRS